MTLQEFSKLLSKRMRSHGIPVFDWADKINGEARDLEYAAAEEFRREQLAYDTEIVKNQIDKEGDLKCSS